MVDWEIKKPLGFCYGTEEQIQPGQSFYSALVETETGFERRDYCQEYWQQHEPKVYCFWVSRLPDPDEKKNMFIDDDMLMAFFERLAQETDPEKLNFRFVIMLILMRKKKLKYDSTRIEGDKEIWRLRIVGENSYTEVTDPHLNEEQIEQLSGQLGDILQVDV
jgi:hypothetical protein